MPKLRYKEHDDKKEKKKSSRQRHKKEKPYKPPTLYEEESGWAPPCHEEEEDVAWRQHVFEAMMEDEGQDPFYSRYQETAQPTPMTDESYRQYIVDGMYRRTHREQIEAEETRRAYKEKRKREKAEAQAKLEQKHSERMRVQNINTQLEALKKREISRANYVEKWNKLDAIYSKKDIPWPMLGNQCTFASVKSFMLDPKLTALENKKNVRQEQTRYHPDKFITKYMKRFKGTERERTKILIQINDISSWLNELWNEFPNTH